MVLLLVLVWLVMLLVLGQWPGWSQAAEAVLSVQLPCCVSLALVPWCDAQPCAAGPPHVPWCHCHTVASSPLLLQATVSWRLRARPVGACD